VVQGRVRRALVAGAIVFVGTLGVRSAWAQDKGPIEARVLGYWAKRQGKDLAGAWTFYCSEYRTRVPQPQFMQMTRLLRFDLRDLKVAQVKLSGTSKAEVTISYHFSLPTIAAQELDGQSMDTWSKDTDGQWCKDDEPLVLPFPNATQTATPVPAPGAAPPSSPGGPPPVPPAPPAPSAPPSPSPG
jgi:hypothetical protein